MDKQEMMYKIILAAIDTVEEVGIEKVTMRKIAAKAGVNIALLNYYFGSKEELLQKVVDITLNEGFVNNIDDYKSLWDKEPLKAMKHFLVDTISGVINYPNITRSHFYEVLSNNNYDCLPVKALNEFMEEFYSLVESIIEGKDEQEKKLKLLQIFSVVIVQGIMPDLFREFLEMDMKEEKNKEKFVDVLLRM